MIANILTIAGSDPSGGAGIQADLKAIAARGAYGMAVLTALTAQNTRGVSDVHLIPPSFVAAQIEAVFSDIRVDAVKIGMVANAEIASAIADQLVPHASVPIVLDPVMIAKGGASLLDPAAVSVLKTRLLPLARLITPNLPEAAALLGTSIARNRRDIAEQAEALRQAGAQAVLMKGGHLEDETDSPDLLYDEQGPVWFEGRRMVTVNTHGTGCTLSSAIAAEIGKGNSFAEAVGASKAYLAGAIAESGTLSVGSGHGPVHHFHHLWSGSQKSANS